MAPKFSPAPTTLPWKRSPGRVRRRTSIKVASMAAVVLGAMLTLPAHAADAAGPRAAAPRAAGTALVGTLRLAPGSCAGGTITGTYFRMILPSGGTNGPYMSNSDSRCSDQSFTPLSPGTDGGLRIGSYQPIPSPAFAANGDAKANRVTAPQAFYGTSFATATNPTDPQTKTKVPAPQLTLSGSTLTGDLRSFAVTWNNQHFNQGAPKPDGSLPGVTRTPTGTYDAATGAFTLDWTSQIVGGPFDKFTGKWHFEGRFAPAAGTAPVAPPPSVHSGSGGSGGSASGATGSSGYGPGTSTNPGGAAVTAPAVPAPGAPAAGTDPATGTPAAAAASAPTTTTDTVTKQDWSVSWPVIWLAGGIAVLGILALVALGLTGRKGQVA
jgi:hypothetical protein